MFDPTRHTVFRVRDYDLSATLNSGQAFRWQFRDGLWEGVIRSRWVRLAAGDDSILAETCEPVESWSWLANYLQTEIELSSIFESFPKDTPMQSAVAACHGLRLLRQDPWECLASFILSSTKQIVQIQQIVGLLCERFGQRVSVPQGHAPWHSFPGAEHLAECSEAELRSCKMGFRAPYLKDTATRISRGDFDLAALSNVEVEQARERLVSLPGVGRKIADCVLLFAYGFQNAFPVDVWVMKALRQLYFPRRRHVPLRRLQRFTETHFGPFAGYAQQYLFHYVRTKSFQSKAP